MSDSNSLIWLTRYLCGGWGGAAIPSGDASGEEDALGSGSDDDGDDDGDLTEVPHFM